MLKELKQTLVIVKAKIRCQDLFRRALIFYDPTINITLVYTFISKFSCIMIRWLVRWIVLFVIFMIAWLHISSPVLQEADELDLIHPTRSFIHFVSLADGKRFENTQKLMVASLQGDPEVKEIVSYNYESFQAKIANFTDVPMLDIAGNRLVNGSELVRSLIYYTGSQGYSKEPFMWLWKPFIVYQQLLKAEDGEIVFFSDSSGYHLHGLNSKDALGKIIRQFPRNNVSDGVGAACLPVRMKDLWKEHHSVSTQNYPLSYVLLNITKSCLDQECLERFENSAMVQGSFAIFKKTPMSLELVRRWLEICCNLLALASMPYQDQDALAIASFELDLPWAWLPEYAGYPDYSVDGGAVVKDLQVFINNPRWLLVRPSEASEIVFQDILYRGFNL